MSIKKICSIKGYSIVSGDHVIYGWTPDDIHLNAFSVASNHIVIQEVHNLIIPDIRSNHPEIEIIELSLPEAERIQQFYIDNQGQFDRQSNLYFKV